MRKQDTYLEVTARIELLCPLVWRDLVATEGIFKVSVNVWLREDSKVLTKVLAVTILHGFTIANPGVSLAALFGPGKHLQLEMLAACGCGHAGQSDNTHDLSS